MKRISGVSSAFHLECINRHMLKCALWNTNIDCYCYEKRNTGHFTRTWSGKTNALEAVIHNNLYVCSMIRTFSIFNHRISAPHKHWLAGPSALCVRACISSLLPTHALIRTGAKGSSWWTLPEGAPWQGQAPRCIQDFCRALGLSFRRLARLPRRP